VLALSLDGFYHLVQPLLLPMLRTRWGRIVSITSVSAIVGNRGQANYAAAKAGLHGATRALALEVASRGVTVNAVAPGIIASAMSAAAFPPERIAQLVPLQRAGTPQEVASVVGFLMSERAGYITGQVVPVAGGIA
jgi:3-oxoacyl-[acyl-carrier protein] reductase